MTPTNSLDSPSPEARSSQPAALRILVVGGVAAGMSAATRARRMNEHAHITVIERGGFISFANCGLPYHIAGHIPHEHKLLVTTPQRVLERFRIHVRTHTQAVAIDRATRSLTVRDLQTGQDQTLPYDKLILAPGAAPIVPPIEALAARNVFTMRSMEDMRSLQGYLAECKAGQAVIVGAGFIGLEMAEALHARGLAVTLVEKAPRVLPALDPEMALDIEHELTTKRVEVITGCGLAGAQRRDDRVHGVVLEDGRILPADVVILSIGVRPLTTLATAAGLALGPAGGIAVDEYQRTSDPDIYAVGDAAEVIHGVTGRPVRIPLAGPANRHGRAAGEHAATGSAVPSAPVMGTAIVQVFTLAAGVTGLNESAARAAGCDFDTAYITANHHAGYYPGASPIRVKVLYERSTGRILGGQAVGHAGVDKRLDIIATVLHFKGTLNDLMSLDLAYAPQFGSAKDPVHFAGFVGENQRTGITPAISPAQLAGRQIVDVRAAEECARGSLPGAILIPLEELRDRLSELDATVPTAVLCHSGLRAHIAVRILKQHGFANVANIKGGWELVRRT